ncbi:rab geranylgeranyl transferase escort protein-like protein [Rhizodiscina lignyota]|uniref:Rab proteins geranylgeranyltransferase n=1 Tax=Rhizodiscina lignyota TaxID=1504668 RepID=A0A9P4I046_9PEZI|nr:rab geranylgeranyl transferase escort protein-like protein [Rhizodiscina lignyota]
MDSLEGTLWDVVLYGTGIRQSLLALALSRSDKKILHIDSHQWYGGAEAAFSLQEAKTWVEGIQHELEHPQFKKASLHHPERDDSQTDAPKLSYPRAYSLALAPQLIYARSDLLRLLVSSKVEKQLEFVAIGSWWVYQSALAPQGSSDDGTADGGESSRSSLLRVPSSREDVFADTTLDLNGRRKLMKFLRFIARFEDEPDTWQQHASKPFPEFLEQQFGIPVAIQSPLIALTLSLKPPSEITTEFALSKIATHLRSIGVFGRGFGAVIPKWGGLSEIAQVACRACAVGGDNGAYAAEEESQDGADSSFKIKLSSDGRVSTRWLVGDVEDLGLGSMKETSIGGGDSRSDTAIIASRSVTVVSSPLGSLFPPVAEGSPPPAGAVVFFPSGSLCTAGSEEISQNHSPVYIQVHSNDTGECPKGQSVLYTFTAELGPPGLQLLTNAMTGLLAAVEEDPTPIALWQMQYEQSSQWADADPPHTLHAVNNDRIICLPSSSPDLSFDDAIIENVRDAWKRIMGDEVDDASFMVFEDREEMAGIDEDDDDLG